MQKMNKWKRSRGRWTTVAVFVIGLSFSLSLALVAQGQNPVAPAEVQKLELSKPIAREMKGGEAHTYEITLEAKQYLNVVVEQKGIDVVVQVIAPDGKQLLEVDSLNGAQGPEPVSLIAEAPGSYQVKVVSLQKTAAAGRYEVRLLEVRKATTNDYAVIEKQRRLEETTQLVVEAGKLQRAGKYDAALPLVERALAIRENLLGADHPSTAAALTSLAMLYQTKGDYAKAESFYVRALAIREKTLGADHPSTAAALTTLSALYLIKGDYDKGKPLLLRAMTIMEKALGADHPGTAQAISALAALYRAQGEHDKAEPLYQRALAINEKTLGADHPNTAYLLERLADLYDDKGDYAKAESFYVRALAIREKALGAQPLVMATSLNNLALLYRKKGEYAKAEPLYLRALTIMEKALGAEHPLTAHAIIALAMLYDYKGDYAKAEPLFQRALAIREKALGAEHPLTANSLNSLALLYQEMGNVAQAIALQNRCNEVSERDFIRNLASGSERQRLLYLNRTAPYLDFSLALHTQFAPTAVPASQMALRVILQRKGRALDATTDAIAALRRRASADDQKLLDQLTETRSQLSNATLKGVGTEGIAQHQEQLQALAAQVEKLEAELSRRSTEFRTQALPVTLEAVQAAVPADAVLIEFASYRPLNPQANRFDLTGKQWGANRYAAYLLTSTGEIQWADLGEAAQIDKAVTEFRAVVHQSHTDIKDEVIPKARALDELIMRPLRPLLGDKKRLLISPDGSLNLIPFDALVDEQNRYLVESYSISYLTSGRDLLRLQAAKPYNKTALIIADPDFDNSAAAMKSTTADTRIAKRVDEANFDKERIAHRIGNRLGPKLGDAQLQPFERLRGSAKEGAKLKKLLPGATFLTAAQATETALKQTPSPSILHISTHGGFLEDELPMEAKRQRALLRLDDDNDRLSPGNARVDNPLLRSGLFFAGANRGQSGDDDGVLTALEAAGLDLYGTKLVVLSACDTGVGEVKNGDGVYGLRRALVLAGSETQVMSLWSVSDEGTRKLMIDYYERLLKGEGRGEALRQARLKMLASHKRQHPYYWASFIQSGEWANLDGRR